MVMASGAKESATAYAPSGRRGSTSAPTEVWLRGNVRPVLGVGAVLGGGLAVALVAAVAAAAPAGVIRFLAAGFAVVLVGVAFLAAAAGAPRVGRRGHALLVRLAPWRTEAVPLAVVECVFPGSQPLVGPTMHHTHAADAAEEPPPGRRVGTLVIRFAERAVEWRERATFAPWGSWHDGHAIVDGRWCERLSAEKTRTISNLLLEAKREAAECIP